MSFSPQRYWKHLLKTKTKKKNLKSCKFKTFLVLQTKSILKNYKQNTYYPEK